MKRPIAEVRKEISDLDWGIQHGVVRGDGIAFRHPILITIEQAKEKRNLLMKEYPNWEKTYRGKK